MGRGVDFYMTSEDEFNCLTALNKLAPIQIAYSKFKDEQAMFLQGFPQQEARFFEIYGLFNQQLDNVINYNFYEAHDGFLLNRRTSECIAFARSHFWKNSINEMGPGSFWYDPVYYDSETKAFYKKSDAFVKWAGSCLSWIRRHYKKLPKGDYSGDGDYIGPDALAQLKAGSVRLSGLEPDNPAWPAIQAL